MVEDISDDELVSTVKALENNLDPHEVFSQPMPSQLRLPTPKFNRFKVPRTEEEMAELSKKGLVYVHSVCM